MSKEERGESAFYLTEIALRDYGLKVGQAYAFVYRVISKGMTHAEAAAAVLQDEERLRREFPSFFHEDGTRKV